MQLEEEQLKLPHSQKTLKHANIIESSHSKLTQRIFYNNYYFVETECEGTNFRII